jgi:hypothetical protein
MGFQSRKNPNYGNFETLIWEFWDKMTFGCWSCGHAHNILWGGRWWLPPSLGHGEFCESVFARWSSLHQRCSNCALTNLWFGLCRFMWAIDLLVNLRNHHPGTPACPSTPEVLRARDRAPTPSSSIIFIFGLAIESIKEVEGASIYPFYFNYLQKWTRKNH